MLTRLALLTIGLVAASAPAAAALGAPRSATVAHADLDLATDEGRARLRKRVAYAAETVCGPADERSFYSRQAIAACRADAIAAAQPALVSVFADASHGPIVAAE